jgi:hypothetical protein
MQHFLQAKRLGTKLYRIAIVHFPFTMLKLDGGDDESSVFVFKEFHHVSLTCKTQLKGPNPERTNDP